MRIRGKFGLLLLTIALSSCELFTSKEARARQLVDAEIQSIDWNQVDQFPLFEACDETASKFKQQDCFESTLLLHLSMVLTDFEFRSEEALRDTLYIEFIVDNKGSISILSMDRNPDLLGENPEFETIVKQSLRSLPRLAPALKRGVPVATKFRIPLVLQTDE